MLETAIISGLLGREVIRQSITESTRSIFTIVSGIMTSKHFELIELLEELDIMHYINIINSLIDDLRDKKISNTVHLSLDNLKSIVDKILKEIKYIENEITVFDTYWFKSIRTPNFISSIEKLKIHHKVMINRLNHLLNLIKNIN